MISYFLKTFFSDFKQHKILTLLTILGVALGVASVSSIQLINQNSIAAFRASMDVLSGPADVSVVGQESTFSEKILPQILKQPGVERAWASVQATLSLARERPYYLQVIGMDLFSGPAGHWSGGSFDIAGALAQPGWTAITPELQRELHLNKGDTLPVSHGSEKQTLLVGDILDVQKWVPMASRKMVFMDISQAQNLFGKAGEINQIDIQLASSVDRKQFVENLKINLGPSFDVLTPQERENKASSLLGAFRLNLTALSLISLFVGVFLIFSTTQAALLRRRRELGLLRSLGASRAQVLTLILGQAALLGTAGVLLGLPLGILAAKTNLQSVSDTISNLYILSEIDHLTIPHWIIVMASLIGLGSALLGALLPALDMSRKDTKSLLAAFTLHEKAATFAKPFFISALALLIGLLLWLLLGGIHVRSAGFVLAVGLLMSLPLMTPFFMKKILQPISLTGLGWRFSLKSLLVRLGTTSFAVASVAISVSMLVGVTFMIASFRKTVDVWIGQSLKADIYITSPSWRRARESATLNDTLVKALTQETAIEKVDRLRQIYVTVNGKRIPLSGIDMAEPIGPDRIPLVDGNPLEIMDQLRAGHVMVGEPMLRKFGYQKGQQLPLERQGQRLTLPISAVYYDYGNEGGSAMMNLALMNKTFGEGPITNLALHVKPGIDVESVVDLLKQHHADAALEIRSNVKLRREVMRIFDQTFAVTRLLQLMSLLIAACGIALTLMILARERLSEWALLRSLGTSRRQIVTIFIGQGLGIGLFGLVLGSVGGLFLMVILVFMINRTYFGWTVQLHWPGVELAQQFLTILVVALLASIFPALRASHISAKELSREDL